MMALKLIHVDKMVPLPQLIYIMITPFYTDDENIDSSGPFY